MFVVTLFCVSTKILSLQDTVPLIMSTEYFTIKMETSVKDATAEIFHESKDGDYISNMYVVNDDENLVGILNLKDLIIARSTDSIKNIMITDVIFAYNDTSIKQTIELVRNYDITAIPVIDHSRKLLGVITADDVLEQMINQYDESYNKLAYISKHDRSYSGIKRGLNRLPWLAIATVLNLIIAAVLVSVPAFEATIAQVVILVLFQPMILDMAGNIGTQNLAVTILEIHKEQLNTSKKIRKFGRKETLVSILNSFLTAIICFIMALGFTIFTNRNAATPVAPLRIGVVVSGSLFVGMSLSAIL